MHYIKSFILTSLISCTFSAYAESVSIDVLDATIKDKRIEQAEVILQRNGEQSVQGFTNNQGKVTLNSSHTIDSNSLLIIKKPGYSDLVVKCPCDGMTYAISPVMKNLDGMRIVLNWGATPSDLDSHLVYQNNHIFFSSKTGDDAELDVDDTDSYGPETITIEKKQFGQSYVYAVQDFSHLTNPSRALSESQAKVFVYVGQSLVRTYDVPQNQKGNLWTIFRLNPNGDFEDINQISSIKFKDAEQVKSTLIPFLDSSINVNDIDQAKYNPDAAKAFNRQGETAYHAGNLDQAVNFYQQAIENDASFSQAYSNLGLAYQKQGREAEAIWANRKAIALANGRNANTVKASSYFNIAKIYEQKGENANALRHYQLAKENKDNPVYDKAIERVRNK